MSKNPITIFISYAHEDELHRNELTKHLTLLERQVVIRSWHDRDITAGEEWKNAIDTHLESAEIILLLISADFLASDYCYDIEMKRALERHEQGEAIVIPIIMRAVDWKRSPFGKLHALPKNGKPIATWDNVDLAYTDIVRGIRRVIETKQGTAPEPTIPENVPQSSTQPMPSQYQENRDRSTGFQTLKIFWRPLLVGTSGFFILFLLVVGILSLLRCKFSIECYFPPSVSPLSSLPQTSGSQSNSKINAEDFISAGEKRIFGSIKLEDRYEKSKQSGIAFFRTEKYQEAFDTFKEIREEASKSKDKSNNNTLKDPEILIYKNNALARLRQEKGEGTPIFRIAAAIPLSDKRGEKNQFGQQILFGVAQAQEKAVNQEKKNLEIVIANDLNSVDQAEVVANGLVSRDGILAIIGHYTSPVTCRALPIYERANLVVISPTSSQSDLRKSCENVSNFFRTTTSNTLEGKALADYVNDENKIYKPRIFAFYKFKEGFSKDLFKRFKEALFKEEFILQEINLLESDRVSQALEHKNEANIFAVFPDGRTDDRDAYDRALRIIQKSGNIKILGSNPLMQQETFGGQGSFGMDGRLILATDWHIQCSKTTFSKVAGGTWFGDINRFAAFSYEAAQVLLKSFESNGYKNKVTSNDLENIEVDSDVFENKKISFDKNGDRKNITQRILITPRNDSFDLVDSNSCDRL